MDIALPLRDAQLVTQLPPGRPLGTKGTVSFVQSGQRVAAAGVGPEPGEGHLVFRAALQQELPSIVEDEGGEGAVERGGARDGVQQVAVFF